MDGTSTEDVFDTKPAEEAEVVEKTEGEPAEEDTSKTESDAAKEALADAQEKLRRYKEQVSGSQAEAERLKRELEEAKAQVSKTEEPQSELSEQDLETRKYLKKLGVYTREEVEKIIQDKVAPFQAETTARGKEEQRTILANFLGTKPSLAKSKDIDGSKMQQVLSRLKRITPADPFNPNSSLKDDLELAYKWAFSEELEKEVLSKAKAQGRAEGHEASEAKVGEGASARTSAPKKQRTSEQEEILKEWGVDDDNYKT